jgi:single-strand DNA-binding protein
METTGTLKVKMDTEFVSDNFSKRDFVLTTEASTPYPQHISFQVVKDKCSLLDQFEEGDELRVQFNLRGKEWNGPNGTKYFNTLDAWRLEKINK